MSSGAFKAVRFFILFTFFFLDLRVRAEEHGATVAKDCWGESTPCAIQASNRRREVKGNGLELVLAPGAIIEQREEKQLQIVQGRLLANVHSKVELRTPYAKFFCPTRCKAIFLRTPTQVTVKALAGQWQITRLGEARRYELHAGLQLTISEVNNFGLADMEFPQSLHWDSTLKDWAKLFDGDSRAFKTEVEEFRLSWREAVESVSRAHLATASRSIASHESQMAQQRARAARQAREEAELRRLFREKNNFN